MLHCKQSFRNRKVSAIKAKQMHIIFVERKEEVSRFPNYNPRTARSQNMTFKTSDTQELSGLTQYFFSPTYCWSSKLHERSAPAPQAASLESLGSIIVGLSVSETASTITLLGNHWTSAFPRVEATAPRSAVGVGSARTSDELSAWSFRALGVVGISIGIRISVGISIGVSVGVVVGISSSRCSSASKGVQVGLGIAKSTVLAAFFRNEGSSALSAGESAALGSTVCVRSTFSRDELCPRCLGRGCASSAGGSCCRRSGGVGVPVGIPIGICIRIRIRIRTSCAESLGGPVIRLSVAEATTTVTLLCYHGPGAFTRVEAAATRGTVGIRCAWPSDELSTLGGDIEGN